MKAITMRTEKSSRWSAMLVATAVAIITCLAVANATQTITTPNAAFISYNLAAGASSAAITPASNRSVQVMGCATTVNQAVGQVSLIHIPSSGFTWVGLELGSPANITSGFGNTAGTHIVYIDGGRLVEIQVASADTIRVHNGSIGIPNAGNVTLIW
jgi:hypothetical protein